MTPDYYLRRSEITDKITSLEGSGGSLSRKRETIVGDIYEKIEKRIECGVSQTDEMYHLPWCSGYQGDRILCGRGQRWC